MKGILVILIFYGFTSFSQSIIQGNTYALNDSANMSVSTYAKGYYGSSMLSNEFIDIFRFGGYISSDLKDKVFAKAKNYNVLGGEGVYGIKFVDNTHKLFNKWGYYGELSSYTSGAVQYSNNLFQLAFYGNQGLTGDTINLQQTSFHSRQYLKLGLGITSELSSLGIGLFNISNLNTGIIQDGYVYTDAGINEIRMDANGVINQSGVNRNKSLGHSGWGVGVDFEYKVKKSEFSGDSTDNAIELIIGVKNLGFFVSDRQNTMYYIDTNVVYSGLHIGNINEFSSSFTGNQIPDSLVLEGENKRISGLLPFEIYFYKPILKSKQLQPVYGFRYIIQSNYRAFFYAGFNATTKKRLSASSYISYGGYNKLLWGMSINKTFNKLSFGFGTSNLLGLFSKNQSGKAASVNLKYTIK